MQKLTNEEKAQLYNKLLFNFERVQEQIRQIKAKNFEVSLEDQKEINLLQQKAQRYYNDTQRLFA
jgi:hypothetical protein